jgi:hypothetical protein
MQRDNTPQFLVKSMLPRFLFLLIWDNTHYIPKEKESHQLYIYGPYRIRKVRRALKIARFFPGLGP